MHNEEFSFVHLTDIHVIDAESAELVERAFREIHNLRPLPDFVVIGGDFVENGTQEEFDSFLPVFEKLQIPAYTLCGNHDLVDGIDPTLYQRIFGDLCYAFDHKGYRCIMLDTTHRDYETYSWHGYVRPEAVNWLRGELSRLSGDQPILLFTHHGLVGSREDLSCDVENSDEVLALLDGYHLIAGFAGHAHRLRCNKWNRVAFLINTALSATRTNPGGEPHGFFVVGLREGEVSVDYHLLSKA